MKIAVTGASGYVGGQIQQACESHGHEVLAWSRRPCPSGWTHFDLNGDPASLPWNQVDALIHTAYDFAPIDWDAIVEKNVNPSIALLRAAKDAGVQRLIFISSISSFPGTRSNYGKAKLMIEEAALQLGVTVVRPGLVWGNQPGGVMGALESLVSKLPLVPYLCGRAGLGQYLVHEEDLTIAILAIVESQPKTAGFIHEATHPDAVSLLSILKTIAARSDKSRFYIPIPWQVAMSGLIAAEAIGVETPFRSDSLTGLVYRTPHLQFNDSLPGIVYRAFE